MSIYNIDVISHETHLTRCQILGAIVGLSKKYAANADDISQVAASGVLAGRKWPDVAEMAATELGKGRSPIDILADFYQLRHV